MARSKRKKRLKKRFTTTAAIQTPILLSAIQHTTTHKHTDKALHKAHTMHTAKRTSNTHTYISDLQTTKKHTT